MLTTAGILRIGIFLLLPGLYLWDGVKVMFDGKRRENEESSWLGVGEWRLVVVVVEEQSNDDKGKSVYNKLPCDM